MSHSRRNARSRHDETERMNVRRRLLPSRPEEEKGRDGGETAGESLEAGAVNGVMVQDEQDLVRLGKEMKAMKTNTELERDGMVPDPMQS